MCSASAGTPSGLVPLSPPAQCVVLWGQGTRMTAEVRFRHTLGDVGPFQFSRASLIGALKDKLLQEWPSGMLRPNAGWQLSCGRGPRPSCVKYRARSLVWEAGPDRRSGAAGNEVR